MKENVNEEFDMEFPKESFPWDLPEKYAALCTPVTVNEWFFPMLDTPADENGYDPDLTITDAFRFYKEHFGVPTPKTGNASKFPVFNTILTATMFLMNGSISLYQCCSICCPGDLARDLNPRISTVGALEVLLTGSDFYDYIGVCDSQIRIFIFSAISADIGYSYEALYRLWMDGTKAC